MIGDTQLVAYPCDFPIKILGQTRAGFAQAILEVVRRHAPEFDGAAMEMRSSKRGKYLSLTCVIRAESREQLDHRYLTAELPEN